MPVRVIASPSTERQVKQAETDSKSRKTLKTIFGFYPSNSTDIASDNPSPHTANTNTATALRSAQTSKEKEKFSSVRQRRSVDDSGADNFASLSYRRQRARNHEGRASVTEVSFFQQTPPIPQTAPIFPRTLQPASTNESLPKTTTIDLTSPDRKTKMTKTLDMTQERANRRKLVRIQTEEGPWSISVAESPYDRKCYSIYIKSASVSSCSLSFWSVVPCAGWNIGRILHFGVCHRHTDFL